MNRTKIAVIGTFDSKGDCLRYLCEKIREYGMVPYSIDLGVNPPEQKADVRIASEYPYPLGFKKADCVAWNAKHARDYVLELAGKDEIGGIITIGGGQGTELAREVFEALPIGFPKLMLSTIANLEGSISQFHGVKDTAVMNSIVDIAGLNEILKTELSVAAGAICGMVRHRRPIRSTRPIVGISCWGVVTPCVEMVRRKLEENGFEVLVFHANGFGGEMLETLIREGRIYAVADLALPEITMPAAGSDHAEITGRLENAVKKGIPMIVAPGGADMVHVCKPQKMPEIFKGRKEYWHTKDVLFVRSTVEDSRKFAQILTKKLAAAGPYTKLLLPLKGTSMEAVSGAPLYDPESDAALFEGLHQGLDGKIPVIDVNRNINSDDFAWMAANELLGLIEQYRKDKKE